MVLCKFSSLHVFCRCRVGSLRLGVQVSPSSGEDWVLSGRSVGGGVLEVWICGGTLFSSPCLWLCSSFVGLRYSSLVCFGFAWEVGVFQVCICFFLVLLYLFMSLDVRGRLCIFRLSFTPCFSSLNFSAGLFIRRKHLFYLMSGGDFVNIPPFLYIWIIILAPRGFLLLFLSLKFCGVISSFQPLYTAFLGPMPA